MKADYTPSEAVEATVTLADVLGVPIDLDRLHCSLIGTSLTLLETSMTVDELVTRGTLVRRDDLVCLAEHEDVFDDHRDAQALADTLWPIAKKWAQRVGRIPFVRMVAITGGLAIDAPEPDQPIDLFIMVRPRRLWMTRALVARTLRAARNDGVQIVPAYMTTTRAPEMEHQSIAVAWDLAQLAVVVGESVCRTLRRSNGWIFDVVPNATLDGNPEHHVDDEPSSKQKWAESLLLLPPFRLVENSIRNRQIAQLCRATSQHRVRGTSDRNPRFSTEICDEHFGTRAARIEQAWKASLASD